MVLNKETKFGLTFGQIFSLLAMFGALITVWVSVNVRISEAELRIEQVEQLRLENSVRIQQLYQENREDHKEIMQKLDRLIERK